MASDKPLEFAEAARTLAMLVRLDLPLSEGLSHLGDPNGPWPKVAQRLEQGDDPEQALQEIPKVPPLFASLVSSALASPTPEPLLQALSRWLETADQVRAEARLVMTYPLALAACVLAEFGILLWIAVPAVVTPWVGSESSILATICGLLGMVSLLASLALVIAFRGERIFTLAAQLPKFNQLLRLVDQALWARAMSALVAAGVELPKALTSAASVMLSAELRSRFLTLSESVSGGSHLSQALSQLSHIDPHLHWAVAAGESQENLPDCLQRAGLEIEVRLRAQAAMLLKMLEPLALILVGLLTAALVVPFWLSLYATAQGFTP